MKLVIALLTCAALAAPACAEDGVKDTFKKVEKGTGQLLEGIGQEVKKAEDSIKKSAKKDEKKDTKPKDKEPAK